MSWEDRHSPVERTIDAPAPSPALAPTLPAHNRGARRGSEEQAAFRGYGLPTSNTTYTPNQFFDVVLPHSSRGCARLVAFMLRRTLGWSDADGNPQEPRQTVSYTTLMREAGISRAMIRPALDEAIEKRFIRCIRAGEANSLGSRGNSALYELCWDDSGHYITDPDQFSGFFAGNGNLTYIPNAFFDYTVRHEPLAVIRVVGAIIRHTIGFQTKFGFRRQHIKMSFTELQRKTGISSRAAISKAIQQALDHHHICRVEAGFFDADAGKTSTAATYGIRWENQSASPNGSKSEPGAHPQNGMKSRPENSQRFEKETGRSVRKVNRQESEKRTGKRLKTEPGERFEKRTGIEITNKNNTPNNTANAVAVFCEGGRSGGGESGSGEEEMAKLEGLTGQAAAAMIILLKEGFDKKSAKALAEEYPLERIRRQCELMKERTVSRSRLGMLRSAIIHDWKPSVGADTDASSALRDIAPQRRCPTGQLPRRNSRALNLHPSRRLHSASTAGAKKWDTSTAERELGQLERDMRARVPECWAQFEREESQRRRQIETMPMISAETVSALLAAFDSPEKKLERMRKIQPSSN